MKFSVDKHYFVDPLKKVASALPNKETIPILSGILFVADENGLSMTAGNVQVYIRATIDTDNLEINNHGRIVLPGDKVVEIAQKAGADITVEVKGLDVTIKSGTNKFKLTGIDPEDYPEIPVIDSESISLSAESFKRLIRKTIFAAAVDKNSAPIFNGIHFNFLDGKVRATATDRVRMARTEEPILGGSFESFSTVVSKDSLQTFLKTAPDSGDIDFYFGEYGFSAEMKGLTFYSRVLEGTYPDLDSLLRKKFLTIAQFNTRDMISAFENAEIIAREEKHKTKLTISGDSFYIESNTSAGNANASVEIFEFSGNEISINFNVKFVIEILKAIDAEKSCISLGTNREPIIFQGIDSLHSFYLVLPYLVAAE